MKSESIKELALALSKAQGLFDHAKKDVSNAFFKSKYADLASVIDAAKKPLSDHGLAVVQVVDVSDDGTTCLETTLMHASGEWINGRYPILPIKSDPQSFGSALTYARRYAFSAITGIAADDDDGNAGSHGTNELSGYQDLLLKSKTIDDLKTNWESIPQDKQPSCSKFKTDRYRQLTKQEAA